MIGIDTNVIVRIVTQDDPGQLERAQGVLQSLTPEEPGWISIACLVEIVWVLVKKLRLNREGVAQLVDNLLSIDSLVIEQPEIVATATARFRESKADFADCLITASARAAGCSRVITFDRIAARDAGMELIGA